MTIRIEQALNQKLNAYATGKSIPVEWDFYNDGTEPSLTGIHFRQNLLPAESDLVGMEITGSNDHKGIYQVMVCGASGEPSGALKAEIDSLLSEFKRGQYVPYSGIDVIIENVQFGDDREKRGYCTNRRAFLMYELRKQVDDILMWVDCDSVFIKSCDDLYNHLISCEITMRRKKAADKFAAGVIGLNSSKICHEFVDDYWKLVSKNDRTWGVNQKELRACYRMYKDRIKFEYLPKIYCDVWLSDEGVIWTAKSKTKHDDRYLNEIKKYL